ncbi:Hydrolase Nlp/P60 [Paraburkholderia tropica]|uniref:C40 family peptidase n=1 Tax=Paraburkholderia tropica TaxID=92647 RepID=UPI001CB0AC32|nr:C40 family peptidase [Paraburkholderia tropica]CAG9196269.1 Hydrolase Nlp/P60 [Paraburkholderia tropica]
MRRLWLPLLIVMFLAACSSAPQKVSRGSGSSGGYEWRTKPPGFPNFVDHSIGREEISIQAMGLVGIPYRWGGNTPDSGFDCSGLVKYVFARAASVDLPRTTADMSQRGESIEPDEIAAGDLVFFNTTGRPHSHVGIYVGNLRFVNAPSTGGTVRLDYLTNPYWAKHFDGIRRMAPPKRAPSTPFDTPTYEAAAPAPVTPTASVAIAAPAARVSAAAADQRRLTTAPPGTYTNTAAIPVASPQPAAASADAFEPPPAAMGAAQMQARDAGAVAAAPSANAPDAIDAAADAFEPPPPRASAAERQAAQAGSTAIQPVQPMQPAQAPVQIMRASTAGAASPAPTQSSDDPIARFANGAY